MIKIKGWKIWRTIILVGEKVKLCYIKYNLREFNKK